jgi:hypothetical protein
VSALVATLVAGGGTLLAIVTIVVLMWRGGAGRWGIGMAFAAGSVLGFAGILWGVVIIVVKAGGDVLTAIINAASASSHAVGLIAGWPW